MLLIFCASCFFHRTHACQMTCRGKRNNLMWPLVVKSVVLLTEVMSERKQSTLKKSLWACLSHWHLTQCTSQFDELPMHHATAFRWLPAATDVTTAQFFSSFLLHLTAFTETRLVKQSIKAHQHPLIKVSLNNTWLSTSMGNHGTVVTLTSRWPKIDSKKRVTDFTTETSNLAN